MPRPVSRLYNGGDPRVDTRDYEDVLVRVPMSFDIRDGGVIAARSEDEASVFLDDDRYSDPGDAAAELLDALSAVPGLTPPEWPEASGEMDLVAGAEATPVSMEVGEPLGEWRLHVTVGDDTAELRCVYDDSGLVSDHEDTFYVFPPYHAEFRGDRDASLNPFWAPKRHRSIDAEASPMSRYMTSMYGLCDASGHRRQLCVTPLVRHAAPPAPLVDSVKPE